MVLHIPYNCMNARLQHRPGSRPRRRRSLRARTRANGRSSTSTEQDFSRFQDPDNPNWMLYGTGSMGDKAGQLHEKSGIIRYVDFFESQRRVLRMGLFEGFRRRNNIDREISTPGEIRAVRNTVLNCPFNKSELEFLRFVFDELETGVPLVIRSSAHGDAPGTGFYHSDFYIKQGSSKLDFEKFIKLIKIVLASEFSESAFLFRQKRDLDPGMAIIIEPVFGRDVTSEVKLGTGTYSAPDLSGFGYSSTGYGSGYVSVVSGMSTTAVAGGGILVPNAYGGRTNFDAYCYDHRLTSRLKDLNDSASVFSFEDGRLISTEFWSNAQMRFSLTDLFTRLEQLEQLIGRPQYIEWAVRGRGSFGAEPYEVAILQISDIYPSEDSVVFPEHPESVVTSSSFVMKGGAESCREVFFLSDRIPVRILEEFNRRYKGYVLVADYKYFSLVRGSHEYMGGGALRAMHLKYSQYNNAAAIVVCGPQEACWSVKGHFDGALKGTDTIGMFQVTSARGIQLQLLKQLDSDDHPESSPIVKANVRIVASEKEQRGILLYEG